VADVKLFLFGAPCLERNGVTVEVDTRKAIALLAYLTLTGQRQRRDTLAALLWPEHDQTSARGALRRTLSTLNKALGGVGLAADRETVWLDNGAPIWSDIALFQQLLAAARALTSRPAERCGSIMEPLAAAAALYRDDFMAGFSLRDSPAFDDWQGFQAESLRRDLATALERLVECHTLLGAFAPAIGYARRWLTLDPLHEPAHRELMRLLVWSGQRSAAIHQYRECVRVLDQELGVPPLEETTQLYQAIKENQAPPPLQIADFRSALSEVEGLPVENAVPAPSILQSPLVGRAAEWLVLRNAYASIRPSGRLILIEGEAGIGKTRLAEELLRHAQAGGATAIATHSYEGEAKIAYGPFLEGLRAALRMPSRDDWLSMVPARWLSEIARLLPELEDLRPDLPPAPPLDTPGAQSRLFEAVGQVLLAVCRGPRPGILLLDDLHWADAASLDLLAYLVRRLRDYPMCLLITWRAESVPSSHRGRALLAEAQRAGVATTLSLARLSRSAVLELISSFDVAAASWPDDLGDRLYDETEGLPFFLVEYLAALARGSNLEMSDWPLPSGVRDLLQTRLAAVRHAGEQVLTTAAVIGRSFDYDTVREASGRSEEETVDALEQLIAHGLIQELRAGAAVRPYQPRYDFFHEKLRALVYDQISLARRRLLHRRVAEALIKRTRSSAEGGALAGLIAYHYRMAGQDATAAEYFAQAGEHVRRIYANADALAHFQSALALGHPDAATLHEAVGDVRTLLGEYSAAMQSYETAAALHKPEALARIERKLADIYRRRGEWEQAQSHLQAALDALGEHGPAGERARLYADWSLTSHRGGRAEQAQEHAYRALALAKEAGDNRALVEAHNILGILASRGDDIETARAHLSRSLALAEALGDENARAAALNNLALAYGAAGDTDNALPLAEQALTIYVTQGDRHREAALRNTLADLLYAAGRSEEAMAQLKQAVTIFAEIGANAGELQPEIWKLVEW
jgi:predicted ATPase/DNA-binding SARP family transcriptional activator